MKATTPKTTEPTTMRVTVEYLNSEDERPLRYREHLDWEGTICRVGSVADAAAETQHDRAHLWEVIDAAKPFLSDDLVVKIENGICMLDTSIEWEAYTRLIDMARSMRVAKDDAVILLREPPAHEAVPPTPPRRSAPRPLADGERVIVWRIFGGYGVTLAVGIALGALLGRGR